MPRRSTNSQAQCATFWDSLTSRSVAAGSASTRRCICAVAALPEVEVASPIVEVEAPVPGQAKSAAGLATLRIVGVDVFRAALLSPALIGEPAASERQYGLLGDGLYLSQAALDRFALRAGDNLSLQVGPRLETFRIAGVLPGARAGEEVAALDIGAAQERFGQIGRLHRIDIKLAAGAGAGSAPEN